MIRFELLWWGSATANVVRIKVWSCAGSKEKLYCSICQVDNVFWTPRIVNTMAWAVSCAAEYMVLSWSFIISTSLGVTIRTLVTTAAALETRYWSFDGSREKLCWNICRVGHAGCTPRTVIRKVCVVKRAA